MNTNINLNLEEHYQKYLELVKLDESKMHPIQKIETRRAFMAGMASMFTLFMPITDLPENEVFEAFDTIYKQLTNEFNYE